jgi:hypothetical protein
LTAATVDSQVPSMRIFISHRPQEGGYAGRLHDALASRYGSDNVVSDVDVQPGDDFAEAIGRTVATCDVLLAVIGRDWAGATDSRGRRLVDSPDDTTRLEVEAALERGERVVPVLVQGARLPPRNELPPSLAPLAGNGEVVLRDAEWASDLDTLITALSGPAATPSPPPPPPPAPPPASPSYAPAAAASAPAAAPVVGGSLLDRAKQDDREAITTMFRQFLPADEQPTEAEYMGVLGFWGIGAHSFAAVTNRRVATLRTKILGGVEYQDGALEYVNSGALFQPSRLWLYLYVAGTLLVFAAFGFSLAPAASIVTLAIGVALLPLTVRLYYRIKKSGLLFWVREGSSVYLFVDRKRMRIANRLYREALSLREHRLREMGHP